MSESRCHEVLSHVFAEARRAGKADDATEAGTTERIAMWLDEITILVGEAYDLARKHGIDARISILKNRIAELEAGKVVKPARKGRRK